MGIRHWIARNVLGLKSMSKKEMEAIQRINDITKNSTTAKKLQSFYNKYEKKSPTRAGMFLTPKRYDELKIIFR